MSNELVKLREMLCEIFGNVDSYLIVARDGDQAYTSLEANDDDLAYMVALANKVLMKRLESKNEKLN
ncbi:hypothetical protein NAI64_05640 [Oxalobacter sp. OxGP1]|mgnify:CR=1 FL=1|uniref:hypothetical protein n=1 Tax=Oxalobacter paeniformigenes TaxID=2946594 RepID=UPI0022B0693E|nr:hypothetical protein [Oxalobacter paeniformigenes]MCZ4053207.1 hypothetical protein [Oxalobacter paeniformigenes]